MCTYRGLVSPMLVTSVEIRIDVVVAGSVAAHTCFTARPGVRCRDVQVVDRTPKRRPPGRRQGSRGGRRRRSRTPDLAIDPHLRHLDSVSIGVLLCVVHVVGECRYMVLTGTRAHVDDRQCVRSPTVAADLCDCASITQPLYSTSSGTFRLRVAATEDKP